MSATVFLIGDTHFGHSAILNFKTKAGEPCRSFNSVQEMDEHLIERWNSVVRPQDKVYHLGDVAMKKPSVELLARCNGHKRLVRGNHDIYPTKFYMQFFDEIYGVRVFDELILSHVPLHEDSVKPKWVNIHGHHHNNFPKGFLGPSYFNVSCEMINYTPISLEQVRLEIAIERGKNR